jgi:hypothetical protein
VKRKRQHVIRVTPILRSSPQMPYSPRTITWLLWLLGDGIICLTDAVADADVAAMLLGHRPLGLPRAQGHFILD